MAEARSFACPSCGSALALRGLETAVSVACGQCGSVLDAKDPNHRVLSKYRANVRIQPRIPLGTRGKLDGKELECIGFLRRQVTIEGVAYTWSEYLLFSPFQGFRWLTESNGHWTLLGPAQGLPVRSGESVTYQASKYKHFQKARAKVTYVLGEFPWKVRAEEEAVVEDWVNPPFVLSSDASGQETVWSAGRYVEPWEVWGGFSLKDTPPDRRGVGSCQPNPVGRTGRLFGIFCVAALLLHLVSAGLSRNQSVYRGDFAFEPAGENARVTELFQLEGRPCNVGFRIVTDLDNAWAHFNLALIHEPTGTALDFGRDVSAYHGVDGGESWSEGSRKDESFLGCVKPGTYYLRIEPESDPGRSFHYSIEVLRDVSRWSLFGWALLLLGLPALFWWIRWYRFESTRWEESDHPWNEGEDDDE